MAAESDDQATEEANAGIAKELADANACLATYVGQLAAGKKELEETQLELASTQTVLDNLRTAMAQAAMTVVPSPTPVTEAEEQVER